MNINSPFGIMPDAPVATRILADDPDQFGVPAISRSGPSLSGLSPAWVGWYKTLKNWLQFNVSSVINPSSGTFISADPIANGAAGDGVTDDTAVVQATITATKGVLFLRPGKSFFISAPITASFAEVFIFGGGTITSSAGIASQIALTSCAWVWINDILFTYTGGGPNCISFTSTPSASAVVSRCFFQGINSGTGVGIASNGGIGGMRVDSCQFTLIGTGVALTNQLDVEIGNCSFESFTGAVTTSGTCTYNLRGCNVVDHYDPQVPRALAYQNSAGTSLPTNSLTALSFDTNQTNIGNIHSTSSNPTRFTAPVAGWYLVQGQVQAVAASGFIELQVFKNGSATVPLVAGVNTNNGGNTAWVSASIQLAANDFIEFDAVQNSGGTVTTATNTTWGSLTLLSSP